METIRLRRNQVSWFAAFEDPRVAEHFGTCELVTPFRASVQEDVVLREIQARNPGCRVVVEDRSPYSARTEGGQP